MSRCPASTGRYYCLVTTVPFASPTMPRADVRRSVPTVLLVHPTGGKGGGMMRVADYLRGAASTGETAFSFLTSDVRGDGPLPATLPVFVSQAVRLNTLARAGGVQLVHLFAGDRLSLVRKCAIACIARRAGLPVLLHLHAYALASTIAGWPRRLRVFVARTFAHADGVVVLGPSAADDVVRLFGVDPSRLWIVPNGVAALPKAPDFDLRDRSTVVFVGNLSERKGVGTLIRAMSDRRIRERDLRLVLLGGGDLPAYRRLARTVGVNDRTEFRGWQSRDAVSQAMSQAGSLVLASTHEALPLAVLEGLAFGVPCITTAVGELPSYVRDGDAVRYVEPGNAEALATTLCTLHDEPEGARRLAESGRATFERHFRLEPFVTGMHAVYRTILARARP